MVTQSNKIGKMEVRSNGDCPWCGRARSNLKDYMCYDVMGNCCHSFFRLFQPKIHAAIRDFPNRKVNAETQFDQLLNKFHEQIKSDKRLMKDEEKHYVKIDSYLKEYNSDITEFLEFLIRIYIVRGVIPIKMIDDYVKLNCIICGREFSDTWAHEICSLCMETVGKPSNAASQDKTASLTSSSLQQKRTGMHVRR